MHTCWRSGRPRLLSRPPNATCCGRSAKRRCHTSGPPSRSKARPCSRCCRMGARTEMTLEPRKRAEILKAIKKLVLAHHINVGGVDYAEWTGRVDERTPELLSADLAAFE